MSFNVADGEEQPLTSGQLSQPYVPPAPGTTLSEQLAGAVQLDNTTYNLYQHFTDPTVNPEPQQDFSVVDHVTDEEIQRFGDRLGDIVNPEQLAQFRTQVEREDKARANLSSGPLPSFLADLIATAADPVNYVPFFGGVARGGALATRLAAGAVTAAGEVAVSEGLLQGHQETRTLEESLANVVVGGAFGFGLGAAGAAVRGLLKNAADDTLAIGRDAFAPATRDMVQDIAGDTTFSDAVPRSVGAAEAAGRSPDDWMMVNETLTRKAGDYAAKVGVASPSLELGTSEFLTNRKLINSLVDTGLVTRGNVEGRISSQVWHEGQAFDTLNERAGLTPQDLRYGANASAALDVRIKAMDGTLNRLNNNVELAYGQARKAGFTGSKREFGEEVGRAMYSGTFSENPHIDKIAKENRKTLDTFLAEARKVGLLKDTGEINTDSYFSHMFQREKIKRDPNGFRETVAQHVEQELDNLRAEGKLDEEIDPSAYARDVADELYDKIMTTGAGRIPDTAVNIRGPLKGRTLDIPTGIIAPWLELDARRMMARYIRTVGRDIEVQRMFGALSLDHIYGPQGTARTELKQKIAAAEADPKKGAKEVKRLTDTFDREARVMQTLFDRIRGTEAPPDPGYEGLHRFARGLKTVNYLRSMGSVVVSSLPDAGRIIMEEGFARTFGAVLKDFTTGFKGIRLSKKQAQAFGTALEVANGQRMLNMVELDDPFAATTKFERGIQQATGKFSYFTGLGHWTDAMKSVTSALTSTRILQTAEAIAQGKKVSARMRQQMATAGISEDMMKRIAAQAEHWDRTYEHIITGNIHDWTDREAANAFRFAVLRDVDNTVLTPGHGDKPTWMGTQLGSVLGQFRGYGLASMTRISLAGLQRRDGTVLAGVASMIGMGALATAMRDYISKGEIDKSRNWRGYLRDGIDKSGILSLYFEMEGLLQTGGIRTPTEYLTGSPNSRFLRRTLPEQLGGPSLGLGADISKTAFGVFNGDFTSSDLHKVRRLLPTQNHFALSYLYNKMEEGISDHLRLQKTNR